MLNEKKTGTLVSAIPSIAVVFVWYTFRNS